MYLTRERVTSVPPCCLILAIGVAMISAALVSWVFPPYLKAIGIDLAATWKEPQQTRTSDKDSDTPQGPDGLPYAAPVYVYRSSQRYTAEFPGHYQNFTELGIKCPNKAATSDQYISCLPRAMRCSRAVLDLDLDDPETFAVGVEPLDEHTRVLYGVPNRVRDRIVHVMDKVLETVGQGGGSGPVSLVEMNKGIFSLGAQFASLPVALVNMKRYDDEAVLPVTDAHLRLLWSVLKGIERRVSEFTYCVPYPCRNDAARSKAHKLGESSLYLAPPSFYSRIRNDVPPKTMNDEYWHLHVDRNQYGSFAVTTLLYLQDRYHPEPSQESDGEVVKVPLSTDAVGSSECLAPEPLPKEESLVTNIHTGASCTADTFNGGNFEFYKPLPTSVEPRIGRLLMFTSSDENPHWVAPVTCGVRRALTTAFTCDKEAGMRVGRNYTSSPLFKLVHSALEYDPDTDDERYEVGKKAKAERLARKKNSIKTEKVV